MQALPPPDYYRAQARGAPPPATDPYAAYPPRDPYGAPAAAPAACAPSPGGPDAGAGRDPYAPSGYYRDGHDGREARPPEIDRRRADEYAPPGSSAPPQPAPGAQAVYSQSNDPYYRGPPPASGGAAPAPAQPGAPAPAGYYPSAGGNSRPPVDPYGRPPEGHCPTGRLSTQSFICPYHLQASFTLDVRTHTHTFDKPEVLSCKLLARSVSHQSIYNGHQRLTGCDTSQQHDANVSLLHGSAQDALLRFGLHGCQASAWASQVSDLREVEYAKD
eukprot:6455179-Amphidinium_carterae.2